MQLIDEGFDGRVLFTADEEIGLSWRYTKSYLDSAGIQTDNLIVLDTTPYPNLDAIDRGVIALRNRDAFAEFNAGLVSALRDSCDSERIGYEMKDEIIAAANASSHSKKPKSLGKTELGHLVAETGGKYNGTMVQLPSTNYHTNQETTSVRALANYHFALQLLLEKIG
jgi:hypothetical protein